MKGNEFSGLNAMFSRLMPSIIALLMVTTSVSANPADIHTSKTSTPPGLARIQNKSLCQEKEKIVFSCRIKKKMVSLCASEDLSPTAGALFYRFGIWGKKPELNYPKEYTHPGKAFRLAHVSGTKGEDNYVVFSRGSTTYVVFSGHWVYSGEWHGVMIDGPGDKVIEERPCTGGMIDNLNDLMDKDEYGLSVEDGEDWNHPLPPQPAETAH